MFYRFTLNELIYLNMKTYEGYYFFIILWGVQVSWKRISLKEQKIALYILKKYEIRKYFLSMDEIKPLFLWL